MRHKPYTAYKDSGVEWLGDVPAHWEVTKVGRLFEIHKRIAGELGHDVLSITQRGLQIKDLESNEGQHSMDYSKYQIVEIGDFAMNHMDLITGFVDIARIPGVTSPDYRVFRLRRNTDLISRYFLAVFQDAYRRKLFFPFGQGSALLGRWRLPTDAFKQYPIPVPPENEQSAIATFVDLETAKLDTLIGKQERLIAILKEKRLALISHAVTKGLNPDCPMKDSGVEWMGKVPAHWEIWRSRRLFTQRKDRAEPTDQQLTASQKYGVIPQSEFMALEDQSVMQVITGSDILKHVEPNDFVISMRSFQGGIEWCGFRGSVSSAYVPLIPTEHIVPGYFRYLFKSATYIQALQTTTNLVRDGQALRFENFSKVNLPKISADEQLAIATFLDCETSKIDALIKKSSRSIELMREHRTALISAAVTGKIDVRTQHQAAA